MNKVELIERLEKEIAEERESLKDESMYNFQLVGSAMRLNLLGIAVDKLNDSEEDVEFSERDYDEFIIDVIYAADTLLTHMEETIEIMNWENPISEKVFI
jgi:hypothetical protein